MTREYRVSKLSKYCFGESDCKCCPLYEKNFECQKQDFRKRLDTEIIMMFNLVFPNEAEFTKADLETGMVAELRNGDKMLVVKSKQYFKLFDNSYLDGSDFTDELIQKDRNSMEYDIVAIFEQADVSSDQVGTIDALYLKHGKEIWRRNKTPMTIEQIEKELGYRIEIIKEDK